jgi:hypothetical protein
MMRISNVTSKYFLGIEEKQLPPQKPLVIFRAHRWMIGVK